MNLYLISQTENVGYDTYDSAVVVAESEEKARLIHPCGICKDWSGKDIGIDEWCDSKYVKVELIGKSNSIVNKIICTSFNNS